MVFELVTGDLLFDPHEGEGYDRDEGKSVTHSPWLLAATGCRRSQWLATWNLVLSWLKTPSLGRSPCASARAAGKDPQEYCVKWSLRHGALQQKRGAAKHQEAEVLGPALRSYRKIQDGKVGGQCLGRVPAADA